ncbi:bifunctional UDP-sugar hydrolase/5'-nucleotidase [Paenibacillus alvei]
MENIHIYHTNDLHSHFENWPRIKELFQKRKNWHTEAGDSVFLFDIGDHLDLSHPYTEATQGKANATLLEIEQFDAVTIGNNEGITLPYHALDQLYQDASYDVIVANLFHKNGSRPDWCIPHKIYETNKGTRIGVIGLTAYFHTLYELLGWKLTLPFQALEEQLGLLKDKTDIIIVLSHLGINDDEQMAENYPEIDIILGAHTHHIFHQGKLINNSLLGAAGKYGQFAGHIEIKYDPHAKKVLAKQAEVYETSKLPPAENEAEYIENLYLEGKKALSEEVISLSKQLTKQETAGLLCEAVLAWCNADIAILNEGLILDDLNKGPVSYFDLLSICPHPINPCNVTLSGAELKEVLTDMKQPSWETLHVKGLGFRGTLMGKMISRGVQTKTNGEVITYWIGGKELDPKAEYIVAIPDMFTFGDFFPSIYRAPEKQYFLPEFMRNILAEALQRMAV